MIISLFRLFDFFLSPLGKCIDRKISASYYYSRSSKNDEVIFSSKGNWFEVGAARFKADVKTFKPIAEDIGKDNALIYYEDKPQPHVDYNSFLVQGDLLQDKNNSYSRPTDYDASELVVVVNDNTSSNNG